MLSAENIHDRAVALEWGGINNLDPVVADLAAHVQSLVEAGELPMARSWLPKVEELYFTIVDGQSVRE